MSLFTGSPFFGFGLYTGNFPSPPYGHFGHIYLPLKKRGNDTFYPDAYKKKSQENSIYYEEAVACMINVHMIDIGATRK